MNIDVPAVVTGGRRVDESRECFQGCSGGSWISTRISFAGCSATWSALPASALRGRRSDLVDLAAEITQQVGGAVDDPAAGAAAATSPLGPQVGLVGRQLLPQME